MLTRIMPNLRDSVLSEMTRREWNMGSAAVKSFPPRFTNLPSDNPCYVSRHFVGPIFVCMEIDNFVSAVAYRDDGSFLGRVERQSPSTFVIVFQGKRSRACRSLRAAIDGLIAVGAREWIVRYRVADDESDEKSGAV